MKSPLLAKKDENHGPIIFEILSTFLVYSDS